MHITKTAGGSLKEMMRQSATQVQFHYPTDEDFRPGFKYDDMPEVFFGHFRFGAHEMVGASPRYAAILRDPVKRAFSHFHHLRSGDRSEVGRQARAFETFNDYVLGARRPEFDNLMCRVISGQTPPFGQVGYAVFEDAARNLHDHFEFVGLFEQSGQVFQQLGVRFGFDPEAHQRVNVGKHSADPSPREMDILRKVNAMDALLYDEARAIASSRQAS